MPAPMPASQVAIRYSDELGEDIADFIANGLSVKAIGKMVDMPDERTIRRWYSDEDHPFCPLHARARAQRTWGMIDTMQELNARVIRGTIEPKAAQVSFNIMKWLNERLNPKDFSRKIVLDQNIQGQHGVLLINRPADTIEEWVAREQKALESINDSDS